MHPCFTGCHNRNSSSSLSWHDRSCWKISIHEASQVITSLYVTHISSSSVHHPSGPVMHSAHVNTVSTIKNLHSSMNFSWRHSCGSKKFHHSKMFKCTNKCSVQASIPHAIGTQLLNTTTCGASALPARYKVWGTTFHLSLIHGLIQTAIDMPTAVTYIVNTAHYIYIICLWYKCDRASYI